MEPPRSWLFAPGHNEKLVEKVFDAGADVVLLDLEDSVPESLKDSARNVVAKASQRRACWVRVNRAKSDTCARDLETLTGFVSGFRVPKVESSEDVAWVAQRAPGIPLDCTIESARGVLAVKEIAETVDCSVLSFGSIDFATDVGIENGAMEMLFARSSIVVASRGAGKPGPSDGVYPNLADDKGLRNEAEAARRLGFVGKSAIHPRQVPIINAVFTPSQDKVEWANRVVEAFAASGGAATRLPDGQFVDLPVVEQAQRILRAAR